MGELSPVGDELTTCAECGATAGKFWRLCDDCAGWELTDPERFARQVDSWSLGFRPTRTMRTGDYL